MSSPQSVIHEMVYDEARRTSLPSAGGVINSETAYIETQRSARMEMMKKCLAICNVSVEVSIGGRGFEI